MLFVLISAITEKGIIHGNIMAKPENDNDVRHDGLLLAEPEIKTKRPPFFKVVLVNDDYTPMDFVVFLLKDIFRKMHEEAVNIMLEIHHKGAGVCGVYTRDVAETKAELVLTLARRNEYPLQCKVEKA